jgi:hypothetical protein
MQEEDVWEEFSLKAARLRRLSLRWVGTCLIVLVLMRSFVSLFPPVSAWLVWLAVWATKGVVDVLEDVKGARDRSKALWIFSSLIGFVMGVWLPTTHEILLVCTTVMVVAALFSGGIDRGVWRVAAGLVVCGCVVGFQRFWSKLSGQDGLVLLAGATVFALLESLQDRFWSSDSSGFLVRLKLIPTLAVTVMAVTIVNEAALARATFAFVLCSPHFIVYDIAKLGTCLFLLDRKNDQGAGPAVLSQRMREMLLYLMVFLATGRSSLTVRDPIVAARSFLFSFFLHVFYLFWQGFEHERRQGRWHGNVCFSPCLESDPSDGKCERSAMEEAAHCVQSCAGGSHRLGGVACLAVRRRSCSTQW